MRRTASLLGACVIAGSGVLGFAVSAQAAPLAASPQVCTGSTGYPFQPHALLTPSTNAVKPGQVIELSGINYCGNDTITLTLDGKTVAQANTDASGSFDPPVTIPSGIGATVEACGIGAIKVTKGYNSNCQTLTNVAYRASSSSSGTAFTGVDIALMVGAAVVLVGGGSALALAGRRRRSGSNV